ncbi:MAG: Holliday junction branch migration protein RuvA [Thermoflexales bacterium]|nr:Holliday junction branch migration protein RuvA [Thermoflexales bacterium]
MITRLRGTLEAVSQDAAIIMVGGLGFRVLVSASARQSLESPPCPVELCTHLHVRENELTLYGFADEGELALFELLLGVSGVGPKAALAVLGAAPPDALRAAIANEQLDVLRAPGVGIKTAKAIILHLKDKVGLGLSPAGPARYLSDMDVELMSALSSLGYSVVEAQTALASLPRDQDLPLEERLRLALAYFARP